MVGVVTGVEVVPAVRLGIMYPFVGFVMSCGFFSFRIGFCYTLVVFLILMMLYDGFPCWSGTVPAFCCFCACVLLSFFLVCG